MLGIGISTCHSSVQSLKPLKCYNKMIYTQLINSKYLIMYASMNSPMSFPYGNDHAKDVAMLTCSYIPTL